MHSEEKMFKIQDRIEDLRNKNFKIEAFYFASQIIENILLQILDARQNSFFVARLERDKESFRRGRRRRESAKPRLEEKTLGELIGKFIKICDDENLTLDLQDINYFRKKIVHQIFSAELDTINAEADTFHEMYESVYTRLIAFYIKMLNTEMEYLDDQLG